MEREIAHYVVTAHPPGSVLATTKCNFLAPDSKDVLVAKSRLLEVRQLSRSETSPFPVVLSVPINGRIVYLEALPANSSNGSALVFFLTDQWRYAVISYNNSASSQQAIQTHASGSLDPVDDPNSILGKIADSAPLVSMDPSGTCIALHIFDRLLTIIPVRRSYQPSSTKGTNSNNSSDRVLGTPFHCGLEYSILLDIAFLSPDPNHNSSSMPQLALIHQNSRGEQSLTTVMINLSQQQLHLPSTSSVHTSHLIQKSMVDAGSSMILSVPPRIVTAAAAATETAATTPTTTNGGVLLVGQQQITYCNAVQSKILPVRQALYVSSCPLPVDQTGMPRYLLADEFGNLHLLTVVYNKDKVVALQQETLGSCTLTTSLEYLEEGLLYCASQMGDSQLIQIHDEPISTDKDDGDNNNSNSMMDTTYLSVLEEYTQLGPILDFDVIPSGMMSSSVENVQVVTASGSSKSGTLRWIRNGIGMKEYASVEIPGIQNMWSLRKTFAAREDAYLVQSFVGETRVLGVVQGDDISMEDIKDSYVDDEEEAGGGGGTLEEVMLAGLDSEASSLYVGNVESEDKSNNVILQVTEKEVRLFDHDSGTVLDTWPGAITVASANEAGQVGVALQGGTLVYLVVRNGKIEKIAEQTMEREISCIDIHPFRPKDVDAMDTNEASRVVHWSNFMAVGLWDDFTVRLMELASSGHELVEALCIYLTTEDEINGTGDPTSSSSRRNQQNMMMARSVCLVTLDVSSGTGNNSGPNQGIDMLFVGLGDGTLVSFAVVKNKGVVSVNSKKEVSLGTQRIDLVPLVTSEGGTCVLASGDRPTVIYLAGLGGASSTGLNPKLCYSNVNLATGDDDDDGDESASRPLTQENIAVNVASPFFSSLLFDTTSMGNQHYALCVADESFLRLGVIDDIQKLHVTTCRLGMAPRRLVHCAEGRFFAVGCLESGIKHFGLGDDDEANMGNCIRFMDDTNFDDLEQINLEPFEMILSMSYVSMRVATNPPKNDSSSPSDQSFLLVGTAYALANEDEPTRGRILVFSCNNDESAGTTASSASHRKVRQVTEFATAGAVYSICQFYDGKVLCSINTKVMLCQLVEEAGIVRLEFVGRGHFGNILSLHVKSLARRQSPDNRASVEDATNEPSGERTAEEQEQEQLAIVGDLVRSISLIEHYPEHKTLEEIARDFNSNWTTAIEMLHENVYLGAENWNNLFCLRRNKASSSEEVRCRLDTIGEFHLGEMINKFMRGSLVMPTTSSGGSKSGKSSDSGSNHSLALRSPSPPKKRTTDNATPGSVSGKSRVRRPVVTTGSQTLFGTVDGTLGVVLGMDGRTTVFFACLERALANVIKPVGDLDHRLFRAVRTEQRIHPAHGFVDGDLIESFLDLDAGTMQAVVDEMNRDGSWEADEGDLLVSPKRNSENDDDMDHMHDSPELTVDDVVAMVEEMTMLH